MSKGPLSAFAFGRKNSPGLEEIEGLLDMLPHAALLLDTKAYEVLLANATAARLTAFTRQEMGGEKIDTLLPGLDRNNFEELRSTRKHTWPQAILKRNGNMQEAEVTLASLGASPDWMVLTIKPSSELAQRASETFIQKGRLEAIQSLAAAPQINELQTAFTQILLAGQRLTGASTLLLYRADGQDSLRMSTILGEVGQLPSEIPASEFSVLHSPQVWQPGDRAIAALHRAALAAKFNYLATIPVRTIETPNGLLAIGDETLSPPEDIEVLLELLSSTIRTTQQREAIETQLRQHGTTSTTKTSVPDELKDRIKDGLIFVNRKLAIQDINAAIESTLGYSLNDVKGHAITDVLVGANAVRSSLKTTWEEGAAQNLGDVQLHRRDGTTLLAHVRSVPIEANGQVERVAVLISDLSKDEQFRIRTQQLEQQALLGEVMAIFAHEVRNPINNISMGLQLMGMNLPGDDPLQETIARMQTDCQRLTELMASVLTFSGPREYKFSPVNLEKLLNDLLQRWRPRMSRMNVEHSLAFDPHTPMVDGDASALEQVFSNLISNAIEAMGEAGGNLAIKANRAKSTGGLNVVEISILDSGRGIPEEDRENIFKPFFSKSKKGTGLGLAITQRIVIAHQGQISVDSFPGGTIFKVKLPRANNGHT
ncbi:MAG: PAS domain-containing protein [Chloroflexi bacterium]|nr:MAG: PAS domain-containing protein [Chloroflexota bacterium]MBL1193731.1 PAS domain-containing protein [Chloroflexota bacterium]NOH11024.1 PAS domain-containing protein [Chloroflexota bacterium]